MIYKIRDWLKHFENNRTRELKELRFVILPNKHDGDGYTELLDHPNGAAHYGAWCAIVQVASKCEPRGTLLRDGARPHDSASLSRLTRIPKIVFDEALSRLLLIGWLDDDDATMGAQPTQIQSDSTIPQEDATTSASQSRTRLPKSAPELNRTEQNRREGNRTEQNRREQNDPGANAPFVSPEFLDALENFEKHRKEKHSSLTPTARKSLYRKLAGLGEARAVAALVHSTEQGYTGCFEPGANGNGRRTNADENFDAVARVIKEIKERQGE